MPWEFLTVHFFHVIFIAWGVGGVTITTILMMKGEKEPDLMPSVMRLIEPISKLIWVAILGLVITGIITTLMGAGKGYYDEGMLLAKHVVVAVIIIDGLIISLKLVPKLKKLAPVPGSPPTAEFLAAKSHMRICSTISLVMWYLVVALSVLM